MAKQIVDEKIKLSIIIDGNEAQKELYDLEKGVRKLNEENKQLLIEKKRLEAQGKKDTEQYRNLTATIKANSDEIKANKMRMSELQKEIGLNGLSIKQLADRATHLKLVLRNLIPGSADYIKYKAELGSVQARLDELSGKAAKAKLSLSSIADGFNKYQALAASVLLTLTGVALSLQKMIDYNGKLADAQSNVMKTTRMNKKEVDELTKSFGLFQTRTSRIDLLKIAEEGGRIGIVKEEIGGFVEVMNKATVALGDSFQGGVEEVAAKLGKLKFLFTETKEMGVDEAYNKIGSAINELGANGVATESNIAEFATRLGSLPEALKPSIANTLALGAAFEESGVEAEVSARAYNIFMKQAATESAKFAQVMGISQKEVEKMINTDPLEFFLHFAEGLNGMDATDVAKTLDFLGVNADGANKALGAVANNSSRFRDQIKLSNDAFVEGNSLIQEYDIKNNNLAATLEKIKKAATGWFSSEGLIVWLESAVNWFAQMIGATDDADGSGARWRNGILITVKVIAVLIASLLGYNAGLRLAALLTNGVTMSTTLLNIAVKAQAIGIAFARVGLGIYTTVMGWFGVATDKASASLARMNMVSRASPWGAILMLITAVVAAYAIFSEKTQEAATKQSILNDAMRRSDDMVVQQTANMKTLLAVAQNQFASDEARQSAIKQLNELYPDYLKNLTLENVNTAEGKKLIDSYVESLKKKAMLQILEERQSALMKQIAEEKNKSYKDQIGILDELWASVVNVGNTQRAEADLAVKGYQRQTAAVKKLQAELDLTDAEMQNYLESNPDAISNVGGTKAVSNFNVPDASGGKKTDNSAKKAADERKKRLEELERFKADLLALERKTIDDRLALMQDGFEKEVAIQNEHHRRKIEDLVLQKKSETELNAIDTEIEKAKKSGDTGAVNFLIAQKQYFVNKNSELNKQIQYEDEMHYLKLGTIMERQDERRIKNSQDKYNREKMLRETAFNNELNAVTSLSQAKDMLREALSADELAKLTTLDQAKKALQDQFNQTEVEHQREHLQKLVTEMEKMITSVEFEGIDLNILTPEQRDKIQLQIDEIKLLMSQLKAAKSGEPAADDSFENAVSSAFGTTDVLGFTDDQWDSTFNHFDTLEGKMNAANMLVGTMQSMWGSYAAYVNAAENASLRNYERNSENKRRKLKIQLDSGIINQVQYKRALENMDQEYDKKKQEIEYKQAKRKKTMAIVEAVINTAMAIMQAYAQLGPIGGTIAAVLIGAMGALQIATISKQPLPARGHEKGLYPEYVKREQDGKVFKSRYGGKTKSGMVNTPTYFLAGENNRPEMVIDNAAWTKMNPELRDSLIRELRGIKGFEQGYYNDKLDRPRVEVPVSSPAQSPAKDHFSEIIERNTQVMEKYVDVMEYIKEHGIEAFILTSNKKSMADLNKGIKEAQKIRDLNKI